MAADWQIIEAEYITAGTSYRKLAEKYGLDQATIARKAKRGNWVSKHQQYLNETSAKIVENDQQAKLDRANALTEAADLLLEKVVAAMSEARVLAPTAASNYANALRNIREIQAIRTPEEIEEQKARIEKLRKDTERGDQSASITVTLEGGMAEYGR